MIQRWKEAVRRSLSAGAGGRGETDDAAPAAAAASTDAQQHPGEGTQRLPAKRRKRATNDAGPMCTRTAATRMARPKRARARVDYAALEASGFPVPNNETQTEAVVPLIEQPPRRIRVRAVPADEGARLLGLMSS